MSIKGASLYVYSNRGYFSKFNHLRLSVAFRDTISNG